jgi:hypothetical protein
VLPVTRTGDTLGGTGAGVVTAARVGVGAGWEGGGEVGVADPVWAGEAGVAEAVWAGEAVCAAWPAVELADVLQPAVSMVKVAASAAAGGSIRHSDFIRGTSLSGN